MTQHVLQRFINYNSSVPLSCIYLRSAIHYFLNQQYTQNIKHTSSMTNENVCWALI